MTELKILDRLSNLDPAIRAAEEAVLAELDRTETRPPLPGPGDSFVK